MLRGITAEPLLPASQEQALLSFYEVLDPIHHLPMTRPLPFVSLPQSQAPVYSQVSPWLCQSDTYVCNKISRPVACRGGQVPSVPSQ